LQLKGKKKSTCTFFKWWAHLDSNQRLKDYGTQLLSELEKVRDVGKKANIVLGN